MSKYIKQIKEKLEFIPNSIIKPDPNDFNRNHGMFDGFLLSDGDFVDTNCCSMYGFGGHLGLAMFCLDNAESSKVIGMVLDDGHIRVCNNNGKSFLQFNVEPTKAQYEFLETLTFNKGVILETGITRNSERSDNCCEYDDGSIGLDVVQDIKAFFLPNSSKRLGVS
jgi:hypothetical protein